MCGSGAAAGRCAGAQITVPTRTDTEKGFPQMLHSVVEGNLEMG